MKVIVKFKIIVYTILGFMVSLSCFSQSNNLSKMNVKLGAYYFDGWTGTYPYHITPELIKSFSNRESKWGWITSSQEIMNDQIKLASNAGLSFFSFCWYYNGANRYKNEPLNRSLGFYLNSPNIKKLEYTLLVANHEGFVIGPEDWDIVCKEWINQFKSHSYLKVDGKPLITFFSLGSLMQKFETTDKIKDAFDKLRLQAKEAGLKGVSIAISMGADKKNVKLAEDCGFDIITGYNYHDCGFTQENQIIPISNLQTAEFKVWTKFSELSSLPYIPVTTLNWDPRPWANSKNKYATAPYYEGFSEESIYNSILSCKKWIEKKSKSTVKEKIGLIYAWNEYGEGAYLTPTKEGFNPLNGVNKALKK